MEMADEYLRASVNISLINSHRPILEDYQCILEVIVLNDMTRRLIKMQKNLQYPNPRPDRHRRRSAGPKIEPGEHLSSTARGLAAHLPGQICWPDPAAGPEIASLVFTHMNN